MNGSVQNNLDVYDHFHDRFGALSKLQASLTSIFSHGTAFVQ